MFGNLLSSLSTARFPELTKLNLGIGVDLNSEGRDLRFIQVEGTGFFPQVLPCAGECSALSCVSIPVLYPSLKQLAEAGFALKHLALKHQK